MAKHFSPDQNSPHHTQEFVIPRAVPSTAYTPEPSSEPPKKKRSVSRIISNILLLVGIILLCVAGFMWGKAQWDYHEQDKENEKLAAYAQIPQKGGAPTVDWAGLKQINPDVVGWIQVPNTVINYPVYQGKDNDRYLNTNAEGVYGVGGQIFMDYQNTKPGMTDQQTIIYGHHLKNGAMFKQISDMDQQQFFDSIDTIWYVTETANYELQPLFLYYTNGEDTTVRQFNFDSEDAFHAHLSEKLQKAVTKRSDAANLLPNVKHVLTLGTCDYIEGYGRTILVCAVKSEVSTSSQS